MVAKYCMMLTQSAEPYTGEPIMEINTAKWELNLHMLEMAGKQSNHLLNDRIKLTIKSIKR